MSLTVSDIQDNFNKNIGDTSTDRISAADKLDYITNGVIWLQETMLNDHQVRSYEFNYFDTLYYYDITSAVPDLLETNDLNTKVLKNGGLPFTRKSSQELRGEVGNNYLEDCYAIERRDNKALLVVNHVSKYTKLQVSTFASLTADSGTWTNDATNSDALTPTIDNVDGSNGTQGCLSFDITVAQSGNNRATIYNSGLTSEDLTSSKDLDSWILDVKFPSVTYITSVTIYWGSDSSNYWSATATTQYDGSAFVADWNTVKVAWLGATKTGSPVVTAITYIRIDINYGASQTDATSFKLDNMRLVRPEVLSLKYTSWYVGTDSSLNKITKFSSTTDIPYFSGEYDNYKYAVGTYAASLAFGDLRLYSESKQAADDAMASAKRLMNVIPKSITREEKSFKIKGISFFKGGRIRRRRFW